MLERGRAVDRSSVRSYTKIFDECFPFYLSIGMTCEQFWEGDNTLPEFYRKAYEIRQKNAYQETNFSAWIQGRYITEAISACFGKNCAYPERPYEIDNEKKERSEADIMAENAERFRALAKTKNKYRKGR